MGGKKGSIVNFVRDYRQRNGWTQKGLAAMAHVSRQSINSIEKGRYIPSLPLALLLAQLFECPVNELFQLGEVSHG